LRSDTPIAGRSSTTATFMDDVSHTIQPFLTFRTVNLIDKALPEIDNLGTSSF
jgi:hypothetical protein